ncbi:hypothetical protein LINPERHAP1_LOCUS7595, partial [Linum perenne]
MVESMHFHKSSAGQDDSFREELVDRGAMVGERCPRQLTQQGLTRKHGDIHPGFD